MQELEAFNQRGLDSNLGFIGQARGASLSNRLDLPSWIPSPFDAPVSGVGQLEFLSPPPPPSHPPVPSPPELFPAHEAVQGVVHIRKVENGTLRPADPPPSSDYVSVGSGVESAGFSLAPEMGIRSQAPRVFKAQQAQGRQGLRRYSNCQVFKA